MSADTAKELTVETYDPAEQAAFVQLNREWIETHFRLEPMDLAQLENPREQILGRGGEILFVRRAGRVAGTCALIPHGEGTYELAKMAVSPQERGQGTGDVLMRAALAWAHARGARKVTLLSNTVLVPAIALYKKHGFRVVHLGPHPDYARCNIEMELALAGE